LPGPDLQTIVPSLWVGPPVDGRPEPMLVAVSEKSTVRVDINRPTGRAHGTLMLVHGMCGSAESAYMRRTARHALTQGWVVARMNLRNCGGTERLSDTLYNAGQSDDAGHVLRALASAGLPRPLAAVGFSLGGNLLLRHVGRTGVACLADMVVAVNPPIDLEVCARSIEAPRNRLYQLYYIRRLCAQLHRIAAVRPFDPPLPTPTAIRTVRRFDDRYTAPDAGFESATAYYGESSAAPLLSAIRRPTLVLSAVDDPFVPQEIFVPHHGIERVEFLHPTAGGHCGYLQSTRPHFWAAQAILDFLEARRITG
jgi:predicted alpha/beta-fold hydrolase